MASRSLDDLAAPVKVRASQFLRDCELVGMEVLIYCTLRSNEEQAELYARGRTRAGVIVTNAQPGQSLHNPDAHGKAWAFDAVPMLAGKPMWKDEKLLLAMGQCGERAGLEWAGRWRGKMRESVHFQLKRGAYV